MAKFATAGPWYSQPVSQAAQRTATRQLVDIAECLVAHVLIGSPASCHDDQVFSKPHEHFSQAGKSRASEF
jgi:hypothetical protein